MSRSTKTKRMMNRDDEADAELLTNDIHNYLVVIRSTVLVCF